MVLGQLNSHLEKDKTDSYLTPYTINYKKVRDLNVKIQNKQVIQVLKENMDECFCNLSVGKCLLNVTQIAYEQQQKIDKFCYIRLRKNYMAKKNKQYQKKNGSLGENICNMMCQR